jgi:hypothetical protein
MQIAEMRKNPPGRKPRKAKLNPGANALQHGLTAKTCMLADEDPDDLVDEIREKFDPQNTDDYFLIERMAKARIRYNGIMLIEASIFNLRLVVDKAPPPLMEAQGETCQRAWAYMRDANGGNALSKLSRYETPLLREYDRSRGELEKMQKIRAAKPEPPPIGDELRKEPNLPITIKSAPPAMRKPKPGTRNPKAGSPLSMRLSNRSGFFHRARCSKPEVYPRPCWRARGSHPLPYVSLHLSRLVQGRVSGSSQ